ncbi:hypothetical protein [Calothrix sp. CCY 0018]|uniref:hypothetical protein n=1 Tax=Calothrix sp. CCY 0018 TaxID=3103864 RepID=UPI0039C6978F
MANKNILLGTNISDLINALTANHAVVGSKTNNTFVDGINSGVTYKQQTSLSNRRMQI